MPTLRTVDLAVIVVYMLGVVLFGYYFGRKQKDIRDYFLSDRDVPWWAISFSIVATETSTVTFISVPGFAFLNDFRFMQLVIGYMIGRLVIVWLLLPLYFKGELFTVYQVLDQKFGGAVKRAAASLFLLTRSLADGFRLYATAVVLVALTGWGDVTSILIMGAVTILYTYLGGMSAVIWTDVIQLFIYLIGAIAAAWILAADIAGGVAGVWAAASMAGKLNWWDFTFSLSKSYTFWSGIIGGAFLTTATHGTDQLMVQRYLCAKNQRQATGALLFSGVVIFTQFLLFLLIGVMLFLFYQSNLLPREVASAPDRIFPHFIVTQLPAGVVGLVVAAIFAAAMSTLSSSLNSSASTSVVDFYRPLNPSRGEGHYLQVSRWLTATWGLVQIGVAILAIQLSKMVVNEVLGIASFTNGPILGVFLLGSRRRPVRQSSALGGLLAGIAVMLSVRAFTSISWQWYVLIGSTVTFAAGMLADRFRPSASRAAPTDGDQFGQHAR